MVVVACVDEKAQLELTIAECFSQLSRRDGKLLSVMTTKLTRRTLAALFFFSIFLLSTAAQFILTKIKPLLLRFKLLAAI